MKLFFAIKLTLLQSVNVRVQCRRRRISSIRRYSWRVRPIRRRELAADCPPAQARFILIRNNEIEEKRTWINFSIDSKMRMTQRARRKTALIKEPENRSSIKALVFDKWWLLAVNVLLNNQSRKPSKLPKISERLHPKVFFSERTFASTDFFEILMATRATTKQSPSDSMWQASATSASELFKKPTKISTKK